MSLYVLQLSGSCTNEARKQTQVALKKKGIDKLLDEAREDNKENDATHMGRRCKSIPNSSYNTFVQLVVFELTVVHF